MLKSVNNARTKLRLYNSDKYKYLDELVNTYVDEKYKYSYETYDLPVFDNPDERYYLWVVRENGTYLVPKSSVPYDEVLQELSLRYDYGFYEVDTETLIPTAIENIEKYIDACVQINTIQDEYAYLINDGYDYEY